MPVSDHADDIPTPVGMIDVLDSTGFGPTEDELAFARAYLAEGDMDPAVLAMLADPERAARNEHGKAWRARRDWPAISQYRNANAALAGTPVEVVFLGDSLTEMWRVSKPDLFAKGRVNRGISGQTSPQILLRFMADVVRLRPRIVHLMCGANDIAGNTGPTTSQDFQNNILAMIDIAGANGIGVVLGSLPPFTNLAWSPDLGDVSARVAELNAWQRDLAAERGLVFADYFAALDDGEGRMRAEFTRDGVHPTRRGYEAMEPVLNESLRRAGVKPAAAAVEP